MAAGPRPLLLLAIGFLGATIVVGCAAWPVSKRLNELSLQSPAGMMPIQVSAAPVPLDPEDESETQIGALVYRGGLNLTSPEKRFGGFSGLVVSSDGRRLLAISDRAFWLSATLTYEDGALKGMEEAHLGPLLSKSGAPLTTPYYDAEGLTVDTGNPFDPSTDGSVLVSFETRDRVDRYRVAREGALARPDPVAMPEAIDGLIANKGLEGIVRLADGMLLTVAERSLDAKGNAQGWLVASDGVSQALSLRRDEPYQLTDLARGPDGEVYALERRFTRLGGPGMRIRRIAAETIRPGGLLDGPVLAEMDASLTVDNMEALSVIRGANGEILLYVLSDDNLSRLQRTLLLMFELEPEPG